MISFAKTSVACILLAVSACNAETAPSQSPSQIGKPQLETLSAEQKFLLESLRETPFMALVQYTGVDVIDIADTDPSDDFAEQKWVYHAKIIRQFRGPKMDAVDYTMIVEKGEQPSVDSATVLLSLCADGEQWFYPGVGARFSASQINLDLLSAAQHQLSPQQTRYELCEK